MKKNLIIGLVAIALLVGILSGCVEETAENTAPAASFTWEAVGLMITCDGSGSTDADGDGLTYAWYVDDVLQEDEVTATFEYTFAASGTYAVKLIVNDGTVDSDPFEDAAVTVTNPPTVTIEALPDTITNTTELTFTATATAGDAEINATTGYAWYIDDVVQENETAATFTPAAFADGTYTVKVMVTDDDGLTDTETVTFTVPTPEETTE